MNYEHAFDIYKYLAQDELDLPLFDVIQNLNWLISTALNFDSSRIAIFMDKYNLLLNQFPSVHEVDQNGNPVELTSINDANFIDKFFDELFNEMESYPIMHSPIAMFTGYPPIEYVVQTWKIIVTCQILLPCVVNLKKSLEQRFGRKMQNTIIICSIEEYLKRRNSIGYAFIENLISEIMQSVGNQKWDQIQLENVRSEISADTFLNGLTRLSFGSTHYLNMCDVGSIVGKIVSGHKLLQPDIIPPTALY